MTQPPIPQSLSFAGGGSEPVILVYLSRGETASRETDRSSR